MIVLGSFFFEFYYNLIPCKLCLWQRYIWLLVAFFSIVSVINIYKKKVNILVSLLILIILSSLSLYHSFVEAGLLNNIFSCSVSTGLNTDNIKDLNEIILATKNNDCAFPKFNFFGLTLANFGFFISITLVILNLIILKNILINKYEEE
tara:strand:- start:178 stop:624 length:447 start_codon:yes stop_codon:yes gene_type:complete